MTRVENRGMMNCWSLLNILTEVVQMQLKIQGIFDNAFFIPQMLHLQCIIWVWDTACIYHRDVVRVKYHLWSKSEDLQPGSYTQLGLICRGNSHLIRYDYYILLEYFSDYIWIFTCPSASKNLQDFWSCGVEKKLWNWFNKCWCYWSYSVSFIPLQHVFPVSWYSLFTLRTPLSLHWWTARLS